MFKSLIGLVKDVAEIAVAPVEMALDVTRAVTKPVAEAATEMAKGVKEITGADEQK